MEITCGKCKKKFEAGAEMAMKQGPVFIYFKCVYCGKIVTVKKAQNSEALQSKNSDMEITGWLIVHDETAEPQSFDLKIGKNSIGRKSSLDVDIAIATDDMTMSRQHCVIEVNINERTEKYSFCINDFKSTNGTILNGQVERKLHEHDLIYLADGDIFQLGMTKIVFKENSNKNQKAAVVKEVLKQPYMPTVVITKEQLKHIYKG